jgi:hypothetical protein
LHFVHICGGTERTTGLFVIELEIDTAAEVHARRLVLTGECDRAEEVQGQECERFESRVRAVHLIE